MVAEVGAEVTQVCDASVASRVLTTSMPRGGYGLVPLCVL
jgi:enoyl-CoA hydratase/carnithine racemase